jgi:tetratricopeptide (TPR) repeat protein
LAFIAHLLGPRGAALLLRVWWLPVALGALALAFFVWRPTVAQGQPAAAARLRPPSFFARPIEAVGNSASLIEEAVLLQAAVRSEPNATSLELAELLDAFLEEHPQSVWGPSLRLNLGRYYFREGAYTKAIGHWQTAWEQTKAFDSGIGKCLGDATLAHLARLLVGLGRMEQAGVLLEEARG